MKGSKKCFIIGNNTVLNPSIPIIVLKCKYDKNGIDKELIIKKQIKVFNQSDCRKLTSLKYKYIKTTKKYAILEQRFTIKDSQLIEILKNIYNK